MLLSGAKFKLLALGVVWAPLAALAQSPSTTGVTQTYLQSLTSLSPPGWSLGSQAGGSLVLSTNTSLNYNGDSSSLQASYPANSSGGVFVWGAYSLTALKTEDIYIEFYAKMPAAKEGLKFLKVFGVNTNGTYANTTFGLDYTGVDFGAMYQVAFGDGTGTANDVDNVINFDGTNPSWIGRSYGKASVQTPQNHNFSSSLWGTSWHHFRVHVKFNSGTSSSSEVNDGAYYVEIDGNVYVNATGLFNRNPVDGPIDRVELFGWSQNASSAFQIWYDDVRISTGGFASGSTTTSTGGSTPPATTVTPDPPTSVSVQ
jgi:hypothetical protein